EAMGLRLTQVRAFDGTLWYVRNGEILRAGNSTQEWSRAVASIQVPPDVDVDVVRAALGRAVDAVQQDPEVAESLLETPSVRGVDAVDRLGLTFTLHAQVRPAQQWLVARALRSAAHAALLQQGIVASSGAVDAAAAERAARQQGGAPAGSPVGHFAGHARLTPRERRELARSFLVTDEPMNGPGQEGSTVPPELAELAAAHGVQCEYTDHDGNLQQVSASTLVAVLEALGVPASTPAAVTASLERSRDDEWRAVLPPTVVVREGAEAQVPVHVADGADVSVWVELELSETPAMPAGATPWRVTGPQQAGTATGSFATVRGTRVPLRQADVFVEPR